MGQKFTRLKSALFFFTKSQDYIKTGSCFSK